MSRWHTLDVPDLPEGAFRPIGEGRFARGMTLEGGGKKAPAPDPRMGQAALKQISINEQMFADYQQNERPWMQSIANEALGISRDSAGLARDQFGFSRDVANRQLEMSQSQVDRSNALGDYQLDHMRRNDERYWGEVVPLERQLMQDASRFDSAEYKQGMIDRSMGDVQQSFDRSQEQGLRRLSRMGINPNSGMALAAGAGGDIGRAKAMADAANKTRLAADQVGLSTKLQAYGGVYKGLAGLGATNAQLATGAMGVGMSGLNAGVGAMGVGNGALGAMNSGASGMMSAGQGFLGANNAALGGYNSGVSSGISGLGNYSQLGIDAANANAQNDPFNTVLGAAAGVGAAYATGGLSLASDRRLKKDIQKIGEMSDGLGVYQYEYVWGGGTRIGVMADEVLKLRPHAYVQMGDYGAVNYAAL
jgi:hypothetical protein